MAQVTRKRLIGALLLIVAVTTGMTSCRRGGDSQQTNDSTAEEVVPVAAVQTVPLRRERIEETLVAYGTVMAAPGESRTFSVPFESRVLRVLVVDGQRIASGTPLIEIEPSPDTRLAIDHAENEHRAAQEDLTLIQERTELKLATKEDLTQAKERLREAETQLASLKERGVDGARALCADATGVVTRTLVQPGQIVPAGEPLLETIGEDEFTVRLGIENEDIEYVQPGQVVALENVDGLGGGAIEGRIRLITREVSPETRLVDVFVTPGPGAHLLLHQYVRGRIVISSAEGLVVPRAAVLPREGTQILYTIEDGHAVEHSVELGIENDNLLQVLGSDLQEGQNVVVIGNSQIHNGMAVRVEEHP